MDKAYAFHLQCHSYYTEHTLSSTLILLNLSVSKARGKTPILNCASCDLLQRETQNVIYCSVLNCSLFNICPNFNLSLKFETHLS